MLDGRGVYMCFWGNSTTMMNVLLWLGVGWVVFCYSDMTLIIGRLLSLACAGGARDRPSNEL